MNFHSSKYSYRIQSDIDKKRVFQNCDGESENFKCKTIRAQLWTVTQRNHLYKNEQLLRTKQRYNQMNRKMKLLNVNVNE